MNRRRLLAGAAAFGLVRSAKASLRIDEIRIGQTMPYSGPASAYGVIGRTEAAYFKAINEQGGVNGRRINLISLDDAYSPPKTVEQTRRLVEQEQVAFIFNQLGTAPCLATRDYLNAQGVPQLFVATGASAFADPARFRWTIGLQPSYQTEARVYAKHILATQPNAKIALLYQNDSFGRDYLTGLLLELGDKAETLVAKASYETSEPTIDSQVVTLQGSDANVLLIAATPKFAAQAIRKSADLGWEATRYVSAVSLSIATVMKAAGLEKAKGVITANYAKDAGDPRWASDPGLQAYKAFVDANLSPRDFVDSSTIYGYNAAACLVRVLKQCGEDFSRDNIMRQATNLADVALPMALPGVTINTSPADYNAIRQMQLQRFDGTSWQLFGDVIKS